MTGRYEEREHEGKTYKACIADAIIGAPAAGEAYDTTPEQAGPSYSETPDELPF